MFLDLEYGFRKSDAYGSLDNATFTVAPNDYEILGIHNVKALTSIRLDRNLTRPDQKKLLYISATKPTPSVAGLRLYTSLTHSPVHHRTGPRTQSARST